MKKLNMRLQVILRRNKVDVLQAGAEWKQCKGTKFLLRLLSIQDKYFDRIVVRPAVRVLQTKDYKYKLVITPLSQKL